jgi:hypothetical protein
MAGALVPAAAAAPAAARAGPAGGRGAAAGPARSGRPGIQPGGPIGPNRFLARRAAGEPAATVVGSTNWSGYAASGATFSRVSANWVEPRGSCAGGAQYASFWVGLDGFDSSTVEQTGTEMDCVGSTAQYSSWYEMYPAYPVYFRAPVRPGDRFTGSVTYRRGGRYTLVLADLTRHWRRTVTASLAGAANSSAEVIAEAPSSATGVLPLANFGTVRFTGSRADGSVLGRFSPTRIIMVNDSGVAKDSVSPLIRGQDFSATWVRSN